MFCKHCGDQNRETAIYCQACGKRMEGKRENQAQITKYRHGMRPTGDRIPR